MTSGSTSPLVSGKSLKLNLSWVTRHAATFNLTASRLPSTAPLCESASDCAEVTRRRPGRHRGGFRQRADPGLKATSAPPSWSLPPASDELRCVAGVDGHRRPGYIPGFFAEQIINQVGNVLDFRHAVQRAAAFDLCALAGLRACVISVS